MDKHLEGASLRSVIRQRLIDRIPAVNGKVLDAGAAEAGEAKPYLVLTIGSETVENDWAGSSCKIEVAPYAAPAELPHVDSLAAAVISALDRQRLTDAISGKSIFCRYTGTGSDTVDEKLKAVARSVQFEVYSLGWMSHLPLEPDPVAAMAAWTRARFPEIETDPAVWNPSEDTPALYWRVAAIRSIQTVSQGAWIDAALRGHMLLPHAEARSRWLDLTVRQLALDGQVRMLDQSPMLIQSVSADGTQDACRSGQISLDVRFGILQTAASSPLLDHIHIGGA
ncbi:3'-phosphoadenosine 5'-phosphosulfate sulfotransferase [Paenibacillus thiaminolyticus]|uniref:3'-phosphoadenosine 5'-phosphosulfate sulfotransferase n=1 Tax=Paenibacillus thiaminolyticus TaxID=49283 RepID=UPI00232D229D|nr:3'-phosphoadenosine 5'-phosphosulfate sulfotransferase [Paenibacillus thiaminolyticus]WCF07101.1 3'-phosphoadenosine 5'-phosphosulfate sulfotransferase [Paenibacillus thiaminolyticus]